MSTAFNLLKVTTISFAAVLIGACAPSADSTLFSKLSAKAEQGSAKAQYNLGMFYNNGIGTEKNPKRAFELFGKAAAAGDPLASYKVGCYFAGQFPGVVAVDEDKALAAKLVAATAGYFRAQHDVANIYASRQHVEEAIGWWTAAAAQGDLGSLGYLSEAYRTGVGVQKDAEKALELLLTARRMIPDSQGAQVRAAVESLKSEVAPEGVARAEQAAASWAPHVTELTKRDELGIREAQQLVQ